MPEDTIKVIMHGRYQFMTLEGIQQLRGPNFTQFRPPNPLEWTNILHTIYLLSCDPRGLSTDPPPFAHVVIEWPLVLMHHFVLCINSKQHFLVTSWVKYSGLQKVGKTKEVLIFKSHKLLRTVLNKNNNLCNITFSWYMWILFKKLCF